MVDNIKEQTLNALTNEYRTAGKIASLANLNYYKVIGALDELIKENLVEKTQFNARWKYRKKVPFVDYNGSNEPTDVLQSQTEVALIG